jgi:ABC-2 type transport system permease protein
VTAPPPDRSQASLIGLIAAREIRERLRTRSYPIVTALLAVLIIAIGVGVRLVGDDEPDEAVVGVADPVPAGFADALQRAAVPLDHDVSVTAIDADDARRALDDGEVDVAVLTAEGRVVHEGEVDAELQAVVQQAWSEAEIRRAMADAGVADARVDELAAAEPLAATSLGEDDDEDLSGTVVLTGTLAAILLFLSIQMFGNYALVGVVEEKSSAVVELLLVRVGADGLLAGKLIGLGAVALLQFGVTLVAGLVALAISGADIPSEIWSAVPTTLVWFLGGFALYGTLFALAGSLVSRQEDAQAAATPILTVLLGAYILVYVVGYAPESAASRILSVLPPVAPFLMPMRMAAGAASIAEVGLALVLMAGTIVAAWKVCGRIYEQVLLRRGSRIPWRDALALGRGR